MSKERKYVLFTLSHSYLTYVYYTNRQKWQFLCTFPIVYNITSFSSKTTSICNNLPIHNPSIKYGKIHPLKKFIL